MPDSTPPPPETPPVTFAALQERATDLLKNPLVLAGGAVVLGLIVARLTAGQKVKEKAGGTLADLFKEKAAAFFPQPASTPPQTPVAETAPEATTNPAVPPQWVAAGKQILDAVVPNLTEQLKKRLAEILPNQHN